jgi:hypothetical protein
MLTEEFGQTASIFNLAQRRGICFVTFFDSRDAERCVNSLDARMVHGREIHTSYAYASEGSSNNLDNCATITARTNLNGGITAEMIGECLSKCGEVRSAVRKMPGVFTVKFYDLRAAKKAAESSFEINGETVFTEMNPQEDEGCKSRPKDVELPFPPKRNGREREEDRQMDRERRGRYYPPPMAPPGYGIPYMTPPNYVGYPPPPRYGRYVEYRGGGERSTAFSRGSSELGEVGIGPRAGVVEAPAPVQLQVPAPAVAAGQPEADNNLFQKQLASLMKIMD